MFRSYLFYSHIYCFNFRYEKLVHIYTRKYHFDFRSVYKHDFSIVCERYHLACLMNNRYSLSTLIHLTLNSRVFINMYVHQNIIYTISVISLIIEHRLIKDGANMNHIRRKWFRQLFHRLPFLLLPRVVN